MLVALFVCTGLPAFAQDFRWDFEWYNALQGNERRSDSLVDPTGQRLSPPKNQLQSDLRLNSKYTWMQGTRGTFRPRILVSADKNKSTAEVSLPEAFLEGEPTSNLNLAAGLQNFQWGPAEFISPTNPFFHFRRDQRAYNFKEDGRFLLRANWSPATQWSLIGLAEPINNGKSFWTYEKEFKSKGALKVEHRGENALNYFGIVTGVVDDGLPFIGEYFNFEISEGLSFYADARHTQGSAQYEPLLSADGLFDMAYLREEDSMNTLVVSGVRWESRLDIRLEYVFNSLGFNRDMMGAAFQSVVPQHPRGNQNLKRLLGAGLELYGQQYAYLSVRIPDFLIQNNNLALRYLQSMLDQSGSLQLAWDKAIGEAGTLFADVNLTLGGNSQELSALEKASGQLGLKWNF